MKKFRKFLLSLSILSLLIIMFTMGFSLLQVKASGGVEPVVDYDAPFLPEGITVDKRGNVFASLANQSEIRMITPDGTESLLASLPIGGFGLLGLTVDAPGNVYAALATADGVTNGVYRVSRDGQYEQLPGSEAIFIPNALVFDKEANLYVTDTVFGEFPAAAARSSGFKMTCWLGRELSVLACPSAQTVSVIGMGQFTWPTLKKARLSAFQ